MAEVKEKAKLFVRDKLASVQQHLLDEEQHHSLFVGRVQQLLLDPPNAASDPKLLPAEAQPLTAAELKVLEQLRARLLLLPHSSGDR